MGNTIHRLKTHPKPFEAVLALRRSHEFRRDDRGFELGHMVILEEYDPGDDKYSGRSIEAIITYISRGPDWGIPEGYAVFSFAVLSADGNSEIHSKIKVLINMIGAIVKRNAETELQLYEQINKLKRRVLPKWDE